MIANQEKLIRSDNIDNEQWKYTNIKKFHGCEFDRNYKQNPIINDSKYDIIINNNHFSASKKISNSINVSYLADATKNNNFNINQKSKELLKIKKNPFIDINKGKSNHGILIYVKKNSAIKNTIKIKFETNKCSTKKFINNRLFILVDKNVSTKIVTYEDFKETYNLNSLIELFIEENSNVELIQYSKKNSTTQIFNFSCIIKKNSTLNLIPIDIQAQLIKKNYYISLVGENSSCNYNALNLLDKYNHIDNYISIDHKNNHTTSSANHKNILSEKSNGVFYAKATIQSNGYKSEANQKNNNLMLSKTAVVHSNPQLEIYNNDVKCSHGSTTGEIDDDALFYMQSRGIKKSDCKKIILYGFSNQIINQINDSKIKQKIGKKVNKWLDSVY